VEVTVVLPPLVVTVVGILTLLPRAASLL